MKKTSKGIAAVLIDFIILVIFGIFIMIYPQISFNFPLSIFTAFIVLIIIGIVDYFLLLRPRAEEGDVPFSGSLGKFNRNNLVSTDEKGLSDHYSVKYKEIAKNGILVMSFNNNGRFPPLFTRGNLERPEVFIDERLVDKFNLEKLDPLILHELGHARMNDDRSKRLLAHSFLFSLLILIFSTVLLSILGLLGEFFYVPTALCVVCTLSLIMFIILNYRYELLSDRFAVQYIGDAEVVKGSLLAINDFVQENYGSEKVRSRVSRRISKRIEKLNL
ncbi:MAG: M48 family metalloprotease [Thermoplasmataceae archaeon]